MQDQIFEKRTGFCTFSKAKRNIFIYLIYDSQEMKSEIQGHPSQIIDKTCFSSYFLECGKSARKSKAKKSDEYNSSMTIFNPNRWLLILRRFWFYRAWVLKFRSRLALSLVVAQFTAYTIAACSDSCCALRLRLRTAKRTSAAWPNVCPVRS